MKRLNYIGLSPQSGRVKRLRKVRELDLKIDEKTTPIKATKDVIAEYDKSLEALRTKHNEDLADLDIRRKALEDLLQLLKATKADEGLVEHLTGIRERFEVLQNLNSQLVDKHDEINQADGQLQEASQVWQEQFINLDKEKHALDGIQNSLAEKQAELKTLLENKELADWRKNQSLLTSQKDLLVKTTEAVQSLLKSKQAIDELGNRKASLNAEKSTLASQILSLIVKQADLEKEIGLLETQLTLLKRIEDLEEARHQLQDDEPCPLCGAKEHPFAEGNVPVPAETGQRLARVRGDLKSVTGAGSG